MSKISVIIVSLNSIKELKKTIANIKVFNKNLDIIVIDGNSQDGTKEYLETNSDQFVYFVSEQDNGIYDAMNKGWSKADIDSFILYLGAGDKLINLPKHLKTNQIYFGDVIIGDKQFFRSKISNALKYSNTLHHQALLIPKSLNPNPPFNTKFPTYADFDFNQRLFKQGHKFNRIENFVSYAAPDGVSAKLDKKQMVKVTLGNFGIFFAILTWLYCSYSQYKQLKLLKNY